MALDFGANAAMLGLSVWGWWVMGWDDVGVIPYFCASRYSRRISNIAKMV